MLEKQIKDCFFCDEKSKESSDNRESNKKTPAKCQQKSPIKKKHEEIGDKKSYNGKKERIAHVQKNAAPPKKVNLAGNECLKTIF